MRFLPLVLRSAVRRGTLSVTAPDGRTLTFGAGGAPHAGVRLTDPSLDWRIPLSPELAVAEAFMDGALIPEGEDGLLRLLELYFVNQSVLSARTGKRLQDAARYGLRRLTQMNRLTRARRNAAHHYDIGNDLYRAFLDPDMQYSCGYFPTGDESLDEAQLLKKRHIAAKLLVRPDQRILDIGCGWGGMALYLAGVCGARVVGVSLAETQVRMARARAEAAGLADRVEFRLMDYREMDERFDRIVSVGMLEHVGAPYLPDYFRKAHDLLADDGLALIHSISTRNPPGATSAFLQKYIFPGGYAPTVSETTAAVERSGLWLTDCEIWRRHYAKTLRAWRMRFMAAELPARYDARFRRMWEFYLTACQAAFDFGPSMVFQMQLARSRDAAPAHRDYVAGEEAALARREREIAPRLVESARIAA